MEYYQLNSRFADRGGQVVTYGYGGHPDSMNTSYQRHIGDDAMDEAFDFQGYYHDDGTDTASRLHQEAVTSHQGLNDSQPDQDMDTEPPEEIADEDGSRVLLHAAIASYYSSSPLKSSLLSLTPTTFGEDYSDLYGSIDVAELNTLTSIDRWDVSKTTMEYLASVLELSAPIDNLLMACGLMPHLRDVKLEEPVLSSDAATDMLRLLERNAVRLDPTGIKPLPADKRHDQDLQWSIKSLRLPEDTEKLIVAEKMIVNNGTGILLKEVFEDMNGDVLSSMLEGFQPKVRVRPLTPLLPLSPLYSPSSIPSAAARLPFTSTPEDPLIRECMELEHEMMATENIDDIPAEAAQLDIDIPMEDVVKSSSSPLRRKFDKISDLEISSPLLPVELCEPPPKKSKNVSFAEELQSLIPQRDSDQVSTDPFLAADQALAAITAIVEPLVGTATEQASNERLIEVDTTARVEIPPIEDVLPEAPWAVYHGRHCTLLGDTRAEVIKTDKRWSGGSSLEHQIPWSPFPAHLAKPKAEGDFDDGSLARYLSELDIEEYVNVRQMVWKPDDLRILALDLDDEEELEQCDYKNIAPETYYNPPFSHVTQTAKMASQNPTRSLHFSSTKLPQTGNRKVPILTAGNPITTRKDPDPQNLRSTVSKLAVPEVNSMQALLEKRRVQLESEKATLSAKWHSTQLNLRIDSEQPLVGKKLEVSAKYSNLTTFMAVQGVREIPQKEIPKSEQIRPPFESVPAAPMPVPIQPKLHIPTPQVGKLKSRLPIVVSSNVMANRSLLRGLQQQLPTLDMIERESEPSSGKQIEKSPTAREADFTLSPSTGLMFTTLQKLKQRPLPGQEASFMGIREQFARVAPRYERLIILLSEGSHPASGPTTHIRTLDERDTAAIADLVGFFSRFDTEVQVSYVPGGEEELVKWIAAAITRYAPCIEGFNLLDEQTVWENLLRKAGMNVFAAQVVLDQLKPPASQVDDDMLPSSDYERYGLAAFVRMNVEERVQRFGMLLGGEQMLRRVNMVIDGSWNMGTRRR